MSGPTQKPRYFAPKRKATPYPEGLCRHCCQVKINRPMGLCWSCYYTPGVRDQYAPTSKNAKRSPIKDTHKQLPPPDAPTEFLPGTEEKVEVMAERALARRALWHPADAER